MLSPLSVSLWALWTSRLRIRLDASQGFEHPPITAITARHRQTSNGHGTR
jgi:hypothetical protein